MWYFAWLLGTLLACCFGIIAGLWIDQCDSRENESQQ